MSEVLSNLTVNELQEELSTEREIRSRHEKDLQALKANMNEMDIHLEEANSAKDREIEAAKRLRQEIADLKQKIDSQEKDTEESIALTRRKHQETINELTGHMEIINKAKLKFEKESKNYLQQCDELRFENESLAKARLTASSNVKDLENKNSDLQHRLDELNRQVIDLNDAKSKLTSQNNEYNRRVQTIEHELQQSNLNNKKLAQDVEDARMQMENETMLRMSAEKKNLNLQSDYDTLKSLNEEETEIKHDLQRQITRIQEEFRLNREKYEKECNLKLEDLEDSKRRSNTKYNDLQNQYSDLMTKNSLIEKSKMKLQGEIDILHDDIEKYKKKSEESAKKEKTLNSECEELKSKIATQATEIQQAEQSARIHLSEITKHKNINEQLIEQLEAFQREKRRLSDEVENVNNTLLEVQGRLTDTERRLKASESERQTLGDELDDSKDALQAETTRFQTLTQQFEKVKLETDRRISDKDDEIDAQKLSHKRALETLQSSLEESDNKHKLEINTMKKKLNMELEDALSEIETLKKSKADADTNVKKLQLSNKELTEQLAEEQRLHESVKDHLADLEKKTSVLRGESEEMRSHYERSEKNKKSIEADYQELEERFNDQQNQLTRAISERKKFESEMIATAEELQEARYELKNFEERIRSSNAIILKKDEDLRREKEAADDIDMARKSVEGQLKELQARVEETEEYAKREAKRMSSKLETRCAQIEEELEMEKSKEQEFLKELRAMENHNKKLVDQLNEDQAKLMTLTDAYEKLYEKTKKYKAQIEQAEEQVAINASKSKRLQRELEDAEDRAESVTKTFLHSRRSSVSKNLECDSDYGDDSLSQYSIVSNAPSFSSRNSYLHSRPPIDEHSISLNPRRSSIHERQASVGRQTSVSRMILEPNVSHSRQPSVSRFQSKYKSHDMMLDDDDSSSVSSSRYSVNPSSRYSTSTLLNSTPRTDRARSISSMAKELDYEPSAPSFATSSNRRYNFYTNRKSESRPESRADSRNEISSRLNDSRKSELRKSESRFVDTRNSDLDLSDAISNDVDEPTTSPTSYLKDYHARKNRITGTSKKYEKYKSYTDQISKISNKYNRQMSPESDEADSKSLSETLEKKISLGPERSVTPTPTDPEPVDKPKA